jgi:RNA-directed DNA polymerase
VGVPTIKDRAQQTLVKFALEPEWEARFEPNSYGFRPGRSCHDAIAAIYLTINKLPRYVLDADISECFDQISHQKLLAKLQTFPTLRKTIRAWLKAGIIEEEEFFPTTAGVPQGGPLSPLLANVALHGLETTITTAFPKTITQSGKRISWQPKVVRYADDFVIIHRNLEVIQKAQQITTQWLQEIGLRLNDNKTHITHTLTMYQGNIGFDFLGFQIRQYKVGKSHSGKDARGNLLGFKTIIQPSKKSVRRHSATIGKIIRKHHTASQAALIAKLNPIIKGWTQYYAPVASKNVFGRLSHITYQQLIRWAKRRHRNQARKKFIPKYWRLETGYWFFATKQGHRLYRHHWTPIIRHVKIQGNRSPFDGDWAYWATRKRRYPELPKRTALLLNQQKGKCAECGLYFKQEDLPEVDHIIPTSLGGSDCYENWQLLHQHCHDKKTEFDNISAKLRC